MLSDVDVSRKLSSEDYKSEIESLGLSLCEMQRTCREENIPVAIIFEGWSAAGKGSRIKSLMRYLDPRGFEVFTTQKATRDDKLRPYMWRYWRLLPSNGRIHIFDRSWYQPLMNGFRKKEAALAEPVYDIKSFEKTLVDSGMVLIKIFLHVSKDEQEKRLNSLAANPDTAWRVRKLDTKQNRKYKKTQLRFEHMLYATNHDAAHWTIVEANSSRFADVKVYRTVLSAMERAVHTKRHKSTDDVKSDFDVSATSNIATAPEYDNPKHLIASNSRLAAVDLMNKALERSEYGNRLKSAQNELSRIHNEMYQQRQPAVIVFEGWDASGKGGAIKRTVAPLDPRGYKVAPFGAPNDIEKAHHYLWRFWNEVPKAGHLTIFDRSWYGRVMVERVEGFCTVADWKRAFSEINDFEKQLVDSGILVVKFWLHITPDEQLKRFEQRTNTPAKKWKITDEDWRNRDKWNQYLEAVDEMLLRTSTEHAPWTIVEAVDKLYARVKVIETVKERLESALKDK
ncbi:MAG: polyphosphate:AMP phosphotransferase [Oscillospiraceae bacterium]|nr:polyphosphate:AMP phosphotransferase [Oscillospiraceae bacterium]